MRRRLARSMTSLAVVSVLLVAVPAFVFGSLFLYAIGDHIAHATAEAVAKAEMRALKSVDEGHEPFDPAVLGAAIPADMYVVITDPIDEDNVAAGMLPRVHPYGKVITGPSWHAVVHYENGPIVMVQLQATWALRGVAILLLVIVVMGCVAALFSRWLAGRSADRLIRPLDDLVETAEKIGSGDGTVMQRRYGLPELDRVATVLERGVTYTYDLLERERRLSAEVGHQLRTPLTALTLRLDEIVENSHDAELVADEGRIAQEQVMRLATAVDDVLATVRSIPLTVEPIAVDDVCSAQVREWGPVFAQHGRALTRTGKVGEYAIGRGPTLAAVISTLLENALAHGAGTTTINVRNQGTWVVVEVSDEGVGVPAELNVFAPGVSGAGGTGLGLATARTLLDSIGGRLELVAARPTTFGAFLPGTRGDGPKPVPATAP